MIDNEEEAIYDNNDIEHSIIPTTHAGETDYYIEGETKLGGKFEKLTINGHVLLNQCGALWIRKTHQIKRSSRQNIFLQQLCATSQGSSIPIMYPEGIQFLSI